MGQDALEYIDVSDEVAAEMRADKLYEAAYSCDESNALPSGRAFCISVHRELS